MTVDFAKTMHDGASVSLRGNLISHQGEDRYVFRDKSGEVNVVIPAAVFDGREVQPDQMINISGSLDKKAPQLSYGSLICRNSHKNKLALWPNMLGHWAFVVLAVYLRFTSESAEAITELNTFLGDLVLNHNVIFNITS